MSFWLILGDGDPDNEFPDPDNEIPEPDNKFPDTDNEFPELDNCAGLTHFIVSRRFS